MFLNIFLANVLLYSQFQGKSFFIELVKAGTLMFKKLMLFIFSQLDPEKYSIIFLCPILYALALLEPYAMKVARTVLSGGKA
jgi:hypothetical protein